jgi:hypothetical protein
MDALQGVRNSTSPASALFSELYSTEQTACLGSHVEWMLFKAYGIAPVRRRKSGSFQTLCLTEQAAPHVGNIMNKGIQDVENSTCHVWEIGILSGTFPGTVRDRASCPTCRKHIEQRDSRRLK